jgi:hypothetical protein
LSKSIVDIKNVGDINGEFNIPAYQRGYRWGEKDVTRLLDDINRCAEEKNYCLQPIIVKKVRDNRYSVIDGQQRLTTLYIIYRCLSEEEPKFSILYETREKSEVFLKNIKEKASSSDESESNIDFWYMAQAYNTVLSWVKEREDNVIKTRLAKNIKVIWYEVEEHEDEIALFSRINKGKIPLTNAELVKALFLNVSNNRNGIPIERQREIALLWDDMERNLNNDLFWYFLTKEKYQTRIDLILSLKATDEVDKNDEYATFNYFKNLSEKEGLERAWSSIYSTFLMLREWYENNDFYHWIGYLIVTGDSRELNKICKVTENKKKNEIEKVLKDRIRERINNNGAVRTVEDLKTLGYDSDYKQIMNILLLFNVETIRLKKQNSFKFPFDRYKVDKNGRTVKWSLEHIHAQQSQELEDPKEWKEWLGLHFEYVMNRPSLISRIRDAMEKEMTREEYRELKDEILELLSGGEKVKDIHSIYNLALLSGEINSALNNSVFAVKRDKIIGSINKGEYVPYCTELVFLKYYTPSLNNQLHAWTEKDREAYKKELDKLVGPYLLGDVK